MIEKHIKYKIHLIILLVTLVSNAQQDPQYTQYMYNMSVINPGYATDDAEVINFGALYRAQWVGSEGGPTTGTFFAHSPIAKKVEMGISVVHDEIGDVVKESNVFVDFAYVLNLNESNKLSFGIKGTANLFNLDVNKLNPADAGDTRLYDFNNNFTPNFGAGVYFHSDKLYIGASIPNFFETTRYEDNSVSVNKEKMNIYLIGGYVFDLSETIKFKPAFLMKTVEGAPLQLDVSGNFLINDKFMIGAAWRWSAAVSAMAGFQITDGLFVGYGYDLETTKLSNYNSGSHEIFLRFELFNRYNKVTSPRFF